MFRHLPQTADRQVLLCTDLHGDKQLRAVHDRHLRYDELSVADVMTELALLDAIDFEARDAIPHSGWLSAYSRTRSPL